MLGTLARSADLLGDPGLLLRVAGASAATQKPIAPMVLESTFDTRLPWNREMRESRLPHIKQLPGET